MIKESLKSTQKRVSLPPSWGKDRMGVNDIKGLRLFTPTLTLPLRGGGN